MPHMHEQNHPTKIRLRYLACFSPDVFTLSLHKLVKWLVTPREEGVGGGMKGCLNSALYI